MRWERQFDGWVLRTSWSVPVIGKLFAGLVYPVSKGRWLAEVFCKDIAGGFDNIEEAKAFVELNVDQKGKR